MKDKEEVKRRLREAQEIAEVVGEPYRVAAFEVAAAVLLRSEHQSGARMPASDAVQHDTVKRSTPSSVMPESVNELLAGIRTRPHPDRFEAVIFFGLKRGEQEALTTDDILAAYSISRLSRPVNASDVIAKCFRKGHITEGTRRDGQKTWRLTGSGERYVEQMLQEATSAQR